MTSVGRSIMRAVLVRQFGGVEQMKVENDVPIPSVGDKQVLIRVFISGVNPVDTYIREGVFVVRPDLPYTPGYDGAGVVEAVGKRVTQFKPGDRVFTSHGTQIGTLAEFTCADETRVFPLDDKLTFTQGAGIGIPYFTAYRALFQKAHAKKGERVLIHGASGAVGLAAVQIGLCIVGTAGTKEGLELVKNMGADAVFNHREKQYMAQLEQGEKFDVILEMLANVNLGKDLTLMSPRGRTIVIGSRGTVTIDPRLLMGLESSVMGVALLTATPAGNAHHDIINSKGAKGNLVVKVQD
ncbi:Quinone oxidoreductase-like [Homarus americanus]|uniref:Quinone oxidoreductase-like n=1 Tax=Homarus americanus TaxID=6706 RepID=A0A8J5N4V2_HOMAM|nr:Quinone oxidoreductase-like [Homarus americanus]